MRSEINALWTRVRALQRKLARELAAYRLDLLSRDLCHRWFVAQSDQKPLPEIQPFIRRVIDAGYRLLPLGAATTTCGVVVARRPPLTPKRCSASSFHRPGRSGLRGPLAEGKTGTTLHIPCQFAGPFHSLVFPAQAGIHVVLPREDCYRPRSCRFPLSRERRDPFNPIRKMKRPWSIRREWRHCSIVGVKSPSQ